ncbi:MAG: hypothetical protein ACJAR2_000802 [Ilumatobacter sp.]
MTEFNNSDDLITPVKRDGPAPSGEGAPSEFVAKFRSLPEAVGYEWFEEYAETPTPRQRGQECTGFALAGAVNNLIRRRAGTKDVPPVSPRMMYEMAQTYDRATHEEGSTLLGALIGWQRRGVTTLDLWPYAPGDETGELHGRITLNRLNDARTRQMPSEAYQWVAPTNVNAMKAALVARKLLYVSATIHSGWSRPFGSDPAHPSKNITVIDHRADDVERGGHAFLIVGYSTTGFWVYNSWGERWGAHGYALLPFEAWLETGMDAWVIDIPDAATWPKAPAAATPELVAADNPQDADIVNRMWRHVVPLTDEGTLGADGPYACDDAMLRNMFYLFKEETTDWARPRLLIFADDGSRDMTATIKRLAGLCDRLMAEEIYPLFLVWDVPWHPDLDDELELEVLPTNERREEVNVGTDEDPEMLDISYWFYEYLVPQGMGVLMWRAIQDRARKAAERPDGGLKMLAERIHYRWLDRPFDLHFAGHGAGDFGLSKLAALVEVPITTCDLWAPATTIRQFDRSHARKLDQRGMERLTITVLDDASEKDDQIGTYNESILCLASRVLAVDGIDSPKRFHYGPRSETSIPTDTKAEDVWRRSVARGPEPILGLHESLTTSPLIEQRKSRIQVEVVSGLTHHDLASDPGVIKATISRIKQSLTPTPASKPPPPRLPAPPVGSSVLTDPLVIAERQWGGRFALAESGVSTLRHDPLTTAEQSISSSMSTSAGSRG